MVEGPIAQPPGNTTTKTVAVIVDNCVKAETQTMRGAVREEQIQWGDRTHKVRIVGVTRKPQLARNEEWKQRQVECLPTVARLARDGGLALCSYNELRFESWHRSMGVRIGDLFRGIKMRNVPAAVERSRIFSGDKHFDRGKLIEFCKWLLQPGIEAFADRPAIRERFTEFERGNLRNVQRFRELCKGLAEKQYEDAFHVWTGEANGLDFFLTTDGRFVRAMTQTKRLALPCRPISPEGLLKELGVEEREPLPLEEGDFYTLWDTPE